MDEPLTGWSSDLLDCCDDMNSCCYGFWCCPCFACTTTGNFGESNCLPLLDICSPAITAACGIGLCVPPAALSLRTAIRHKYRIQGSLCKDIMTSCFCVWCSWCQMSREIKKHKKRPVVIQAQPPPVVVNVQQAPVAAAPQVNIVNNQNSMPASPPVVVPGYGFQPMVSPAVMAPAPGYGPQPMVNPAIMASPKYYGP